MEGKYGRRGVSADKHDVHHATQHLGKGIYPYAFCKVTPDILLGDPAYCTLMHADGAGTKSALAYLYWKETGDISVWRGIVQDAIVMNLDDMLCVGATHQFLISNTIGRNGFLIPREVLTEMLEGMEDFALMLREYDIDLVSTGGETADVGDLVKTIVFDATVYTRMLRSEVITNEKIAPGDVIIGLSSSGQTLYENQYNSGIGSNGLTNARHDVLASVYKEKYPETYDPQIPDHLVYSGKYLVTDTYEGLPLSVGKSLLSPTRTYLPFIHKLLQQHRTDIHGLIHCTGGGQTKCLKYVRNLHIIKDNLFPTPPIFHLIQNSSNTTWEEMYKVFNMGHRLEVYTSAQKASLIIEAAHKMQIEAQIIGKCELSDANRLTLETEHGVFTYS